MKYTGAFIFLITIMIYFRPAASQFYLTGEEPSSIRWMQMRTSGFRIVYPDGLYDDAARLASELQRTSASTSLSYTRSAKHMPILLHSQSVLSNGYVTWTPRRMELVTTPPQDSYAQDWISQLALHEYRHVVQLSQLDQGFTSALSFLLGEIAPGVVSSMLPSWFYEGDAVVNETLNSQSGRGRVPSFEMPLRTMLLENRKIFSYSKAFMGSYRDYVPNQYQYGYPIVSYANIRYGTGIWPAAVNYTARHPYLVAPFVIYLARKYHINRAKMYRQTMDSLKTIYIKKEDVTTYSNYLSKNDRKSKLYTSYRLPHAAGNGIVALKTGIDQLDYFVFIDSTGKEKRVVTPCSFRRLKADVQGDYLAWDEGVADPRWGRRDYSEIRLFDLKSRRLRNLTKKSRYFSPDISPDGNTIAVAETDVRDHNFLSLINIQNGKCIKQIPSVQNREIQFPEWLSGTRLVVITVSQKGKQLEEIDINTGIWKVILPFTRFNIAEPVMYRNYILFRSSYDNSAENIYALDPKEQKIFQVTFSRFGAFNPSVSADSSHLLFSDYTGQGYNIASIPLLPSKWKEIRLPENPSGIWPGTGAERRSQVISSIPPVQERPDTGLYSKAAHLFHFHSWLPLYVPVGGLKDPVSTLPISAGLMLFSQNLLSTLTSTLSYHYSHGYHFITPGFIWRGWYPVFEFSGQFGGPAEHLPFPEGVTLSDKNEPHYEYHASAYIPLVFNRGRIISYFTPQVELEHMKTYYYSGNQISSGINYVHFRLYMSRFLRMSLRDLYPRIGQSVSAGYTISPGDPDLLGSLVYVQTGLYFPGIGRHHHLIIKGGYQKQYLETYFLPINRISFPRGYSSAVSAELAALSMDYAFPVAYPDLSVSPVIYLKRLRADLFHDMSYGTLIAESNTSRYTGSYSSTGMEILADFHLFRLLFPLSAGVRVGYMHDRNRFFSEFLLDIQLNVQ